MLNSVVATITPNALGVVNPGVSPDKSTGSSKPSPSLSGVVSDLANSVMLGDKLDARTPLGKMVREKLSEDKGMGLMSGRNPQETVKNALMDIVKDKMGSNFIAGAGGRDSKELMNEVMGGLGQSALNNALKPKGDGSTFDSADKPLLQQVADYMDKNKAEFGAPHKTGSWSKELDEDNYLNKGETAKFKQALEQVSQQLGAGSSRTDYPGAEKMMGGAQGGLGSSPSSSSGEMTELERLRQMLNSGDGMNVFKEGLQMGLGIASGAQANPLMSQGGQSASHAAQSVLDVMHASVS